MKIAIAGGHSKKSPGAIGHLDEYECDRAFVAKLIPALASAGHTVANCSNEKADQSSELAEEVRLANESKADLFLAVHFNAGGGTGTECFTYTKTTSQLAKDISAKMSANVASALGIRNRGAKTAGFYVLRKTDMPAVLIEVCFVDSEKDAAAWRGTSWDALCKAVVDAIGPEGTATKPAPGTNSAASGASDKPSDSKEEEVYNFPTVKKGMKGNHVAMFQATYNTRFGKSIAVDKSAGPETDGAIYDAQERLGIAKDRSCGPDTWKHLLSK